MARIDLVTHEQASPDVRAFYAGLEERGLTDEDYAKLRVHYPEEQIVTLCLLMSLSRLFGDLANALHIPLDAFVKPPSGTWWRSPRQRGVPCLPW